jgi:hypothetical protein
VRHLNPYVLLARKRDEEMAERARKAHEEDMNRQERTMNHYRAVQVGEAASVFEFEGPSTSEFGRPRSMRVAVASQDEADYVARLLSRAYEAGRAAKLAEIQAALR